MVLTTNENLKVETGNGGGEDVIKSFSQTPLQSTATTPKREEKDQTKNAFFKTPNFAALGSPTQKFRQLAFEKDEISRTVASSSGSHHLRQRLGGIFSRKIDWDSLQHVMKEWFTNPMNIALFIWILCVTISGAILFLVMTGMLNRALPKKSQRDAWFEVNNQILNALFTLMCLYQHPKRFHHLAMLIKWSPKDISKLRKIYCKNGTYKPHEWAHMMVVVMLLHLNCFAQYALCGLNVGYRRSQRPPIGVAICISVAIAAPAVAGVYTVVSPLGREYEIHDGDDEELQGTPLRGQLRLKSFERRMSFASGEENVETNPTWRGGIPDLWEDISVAYLSLFCAFCVFGWNMDRLGFGNMYVHIATFILFCTAPYWIFNLAALNIDNEDVRHGLGVTGTLLCIFGLLYGGYWRIRMRKRFNLPTYTFCCGKPGFSDCALWLFCCWCSLAQEARTANSYTLVDNKFHLRKDDSAELVRPDDGMAAEIGSGFEFSSPVLVGSSTTAAANKGDKGLENQVISAEDESSGVTNSECMVAPSPLLMSKTEKL